MRILRLALLLLWLAAMSQIAACETVVAQASSNESRPIARLIVKPYQVFADADALMAAIRDKLPTEPPIAFFRAMSGDAYVLSVVAPATPDDVPKIIEQLRGTGLFEYVELDRLKTIRLNVH